MSTLSGIRVLVVDDDDAVASEQVKLYVGYLRRQLELAIGTGDGPIETVRGCRYRPAAVTWTPAIPVEG